MIQATERDYNKQKQDHWKENTKKKKKKIQNQSHLNPDLPSGLSTSCVSVSKRELQTNLFAHN